MTKVRELQDGDIVDLLELGEDYPLGEATRLVAEYESAVVTAESDQGTPWTVETPDCWVLHTNSGSFGMSPDQEFNVKGRAW